MRISFATYSLVSDSLVAMSPIFSELDGRACAIRNMQRNPNSSCAVSFMMLFCSFRGFARTTFFVLA
jgi:hypothetical protein